jgi:ribonuclease-3
MSLWGRIKKLFTPSEVLSSIDLARLQSLLGYRFKDPSLLQLSLTHRSHVRSVNGGIPSNERLEFLGDSVLGLVVAEQLYRDHPGLAEGDLTKWKAKLVSETALSRVATEIGLNRYVLLSAEEEAAGGRERPSIISDAYEAVIAATFLDGGLAEARRLILTTLYDRRRDLLHDRSQQNYKGDLLELVQGRGGNAPLYEVVRETGPDHDKTFHVVVSVDGRPVGEGEGPSKKEAEQRAAAVALTQLQPDYRI